MKIHASCRVKRGVNKTECDDSCLLGTQLVNDASASVSCAVPTRIYLCDGVGGNAGGRDASLFVCSHPGDDFAALNEELIRYGRQIGKPTMATTLTGLIFTDSTVTLVHAGNTRLYALRGGFLNRLTTDHTTREWLLSFDRTEEAELCNSSEIRCAFGGGNPGYLRPLVVRELFSDRIPKTLLLTTDGIHDYLSEDQMEDILLWALPPLETIDLLIAAAEQNGSEDDCSAVLLTLEEDGNRDEA